MKKVTKKAATAKKPVATAKKPAKTSKGKQRHFVKMHGIGNDMILFDCLKSPISNPPHAARKLCNRHTGI